jgi:hypothetical protein
VQRGLLAWVWRCVEEPFATVNFREHLFFEVGRISRRGTGAF